MVRTAADPASLIARIRAEAAAMDPDVPIAELSTLASYVANAMSQTRFLLALIGAFAALALGLASLGLYGVISYSAKQRTREIGVRVAFGATERDVMRLILGQGLVVALAGIGLGLAGAAALTRVASSFLVGVSPDHLRGRAGAPARRCHPHVVRPGAAGGPCRSERRAARRLISSERRADGSPSCSRLTAFACYELVNGKSPREAIQEVRLRPLGLRRDRLRVRRLASGEAGDRASGADLPA